MIIRFKNKKEYDEWLKWQSFQVREKGKRFIEVYGDDILPIVIVLNVDTSQSGEWAAAHLFLHPQAEELINKWVVTE